MPILLVQNKPYERSFIFLSGSFASLVVMGLLFARGFAAIILRVETDNAWLIPSIEAVAGILLLVIAGVVFWRIKTSTLSIEPSNQLVKRLKLGNGQLFLVGALIVAVQSLVDVVFLLAMIRVGHLHEHTIILIAAILTYAFAALVLQLAVIVAYWLAPAGQKSKTLEKVHNLLERYANQLICYVSLSLGLILIGLAWQSQVL